MDSQKKSFGPLIGIAIIVILVIIGAVYFWNSRNNAQNNETMMAQESTVAPVAPVSSSDDVNTLDAEINAPTSAPDLNDLNGI